MDIDKLFASPFHQSAMALNAEVKTWPWTKVLFPLTQYIKDQGDEFFKSVWKVIDESKTYVWIITYAMDKSIPANTTLIKLIEAKKRGVNTVLLVDDLNQSVDKNLIRKYISVGGVYRSLNPQFKLSSLTKFANKEIFRRHHQKVIVSDNRSIVGSSNLETGYASTKFGSRVFRDFNFYSENINLEEQRQYFRTTADFYNIQLFPGKNNAALMKNLKPLYPDSQFVLPGTFKFLRSHQPDIQEIQDEVLENIKHAQKSILVVQPYYYPVKRFERAVSEAMARGVKVQLVTSAKRDQPVYKSIKNYLLLKKLIQKGLKVYESHQKILHSKVYIFDQKVMTIGSFNNDRWSWKINNEANVSIHSEYEYKRVKNYFEDLKLRCRPAVEKNDIGFTRRLRMMFWERFLYLSEVVMSKRGFFDFRKFWSKSPMSAPDEDDEHENKPKEGKL